VARRIRQEEFTKDLTGEERIWQNLRWLIGEIEADQDALAEDLREALKMLDWLKSDLETLTRYLRRLKRQRQEGEGDDDAGN
jgi:hypothetical protein